MNRQYLRALGAAVALALIMLDPQSAVEAARKSMAIWADAVAPALFPFMLVTPALTGDEMCALYRRALGRWMQPLFGMTGDSAAAVAVAWLAGNPSGAIALSAVARRSAMTRGQLIRAALMASGASPAFYLTSVGAAMLGAPQLGWLMLRSQWAALLAAALIFGRCPSDNRPVLIEQSDDQAPRVRPVAGAVNGVLMVAGYMAFFSVLARQIAHLIGPAMELPALAFLEFSGGCAALSAHASLPWALRLPLISAVACFGGLSSLAQAMSAIGPLGASPGVYLAGKLAQGLLAFGATALQLRLWPSIAPAFAQVPQSLTSAAFPAALAASILLVGAMAWHLSAGKRKSEGR